MQIVDWLGPDFDGVLVFDESQHGECSAEEGARGKMDASKQALAGIELQKQLSKARVIYVSPRPEPRSIESCLRTAPRPVGRGHGVLRPQ